MERQTRHKGDLDQRDVLEKLREVLEHGAGRLEVVVRNHEVSTITSTQVEETWAWPQGAVQVNGLEVDLHALLYLADGRALARSTVSKEDVLERLWGLLAYGFGRLEVLVRDREVAAIASSRVLVRG